MLTRKSIKNITIGLACLLIIFLLYLFPKSDEIYSSSTTYNVEGISDVIYPINSDGYVSRIKVPLKESSTHQKIKEIVKYLTIDSDKSLLLPKGFSPILPKDTLLLKETIEDKNLKLYFNNKFYQINPNNEEKIIESLIYSLTSLKDIDSISIYVDNKLLTSLPNSKISIPEKMDKSYGINKIYDIDSLKNITKTTIYYISKNDSTNYYIPVTKITNDTKSKIEIIIKELTSKPIYETNLMSYLNSEATLNSYNILDKEISLEFNNAILDGIDKNSMLEEVTYAINLSVKSNYDVDYVSYFVENKKIATFDLKELEN